MVAAPQDRWRRAAGYMDAMHGMCEKCHTNHHIATPDRFAENLARCDACHNAGHAEKLAAMRPSPDNTRGHSFDTSSREQE
jgi:hypothetical protein